MVVLQRTVSLVAGIAILAGVSVDYFIGGRMLLNYGAFYIPLAGLLIAIPFIMHILFDGKTTSLKTSEDEDCIIAYSFAE